METEPANGCAMAQAISHWPGVHSGPVHVTSLAETIAMAQVSLPVLQFSPSVSFHQCCTLLSKEVQAKVRSLHTQHCSFGYRMALHRTLLSHCQYSKY